MEGDWSSREGRLPRLDRDGRTLSDSDYCLPSPPERDLSTIHLSQVSLDGGYGGDVSSEAGSSEVFHHCQQPSYAHSEGYYSYVSSTDSITPFIDRLKRELEFTEVQENSSSVSSHGGTSVKWEESDTDTFVAPRDRSTIKADCESVWHFRGSSGDLVTPSSRPSLTNASSRLASPPLSSDSARVSYQSRVPLFHNATYECVNLDNSSRLSTQSHVVSSHPAGISHTSRPQINHGCITTNVSKATRLPANHCRSCDVAYPGRVPPTLNLETTDVTYPSRLHSNGSACDGPSGDRLQISNNANREHVNSRSNKAQPQISNSSRIHHLHSSNSDSINASSNRLYSYDSTNHLSRSSSNQNESLHHSRLSTNHPDTKIYSSRQQSKHNDSTAMLHSNHIDSTNHTNRAHQTDTALSKTKEAHKSNHGDPSNHPARAHSVHSDTSNHCIPKIFNVGESTNLTRLHSNHCDSSSNNSIRMQSNHSEVLNTSRHYSGRSSTSDFINLSHSSRDLNTHPSSGDGINLDQSSRLTAKTGSDSSSVNHPLRISCHSSSHGSSSESSASHPNKIHSHSSGSSESSNSTHSSRVHSHSSLSVSSDISNLSFPTRTHSNHIVNSDAVPASHSPRVHNPQNHTVNADSGIPNHSSKIHSHSMNESTNSNLTSRILPNSSDSNTSQSNSSRNHSHSSLNDLATPHHNSRLHSHPSSTNETLNTSLSTRIYTHSSHSISNESANIARSSRVPPPQRHLSQSVLYLSADHRKLFPISTYQPEPPRVVGAVSVSERVVELENRLGGLKALQKKALLSFYQRHQVSAPAPPPPPRRASSASDYLQLKGCIESSSTVSGSSQNSNGIKESSPTSSCSSSTSSNNSLIKDARQLHRSCGSLSGISGPVIVGRSISVDDWVPARPPKGAHLRPAAPQPPSPEAPQAAARQPPSASSSTQLSSNSNSALTQSPDKLSGSHRLNNSTESVRSSVHRNLPRAASPEPPPPPSSPPQHYSDEPLPPPPDPEELSPLPPTLPSRHPSPGPQVPLNQDATQQIQAVDTRVSSDLSAIKSTNSDDKTINSVVLDLKPPKCTDVSPNNVSVDKIPLELQTVTPLPEKVSNSNGIDISQSILNEQNCKKESAVSSSCKKELSKLKSPLNIKNAKSAADSQNLFKTVSSETSFKPLSDVEPSANSKGDSFSPRSSPFLTTSGKVSPGKLNSSGMLSNVDNINNKSNDLDSTSEQQLDFQTIKQLNHCAIDPTNDELIQKASTKVLSRNASRDKLNQPISLENSLKLDEVHEETPSKEVKKLLRKTSFRCSERIQQSITTLQNSIRSSSPQKFQESQKELLYRDFMSKDILKDFLPKEPVVKDILSDDLVTNDASSQDSCKQAVLDETVTKDVLDSDLLSKDSIANDILSKAVLNADKYVKDLLANDIITQESVSKDISKNSISEDKWASTVLTAEASPSKLCLSLSRLDHIDFTEKLISSFTSRSKCGVDDKEDSISDCDLEKSCSMSQHDTNMSVGTLQQKKEELITRLSRKLSVLRAEAAAVAEETTTNEELGEAVVERVASAWGSREAARLRSHVADLGRLTALLLTLTTRLARADNALLALSSTHPDKCTLEAKRDRLASQLEEARRLKEKVDRRNEAVTSKLRERLTSEEFSDFMHFVSLKSKLLLDSREIADKIKLGEEQLQALQMTLSAVT